MDWRKLFNSFVTALSIVILASGFITALVWTFLTFGGVGLMLVTLGGLIAMLTALSYFEP